MIAGLLKNSCQVLRWRGFVQRVLSHCPESEDEGLASVANPFFGEIEGSPISNPASCAVSIFSTSGAMGANVLPPPSHFSNRILMRATEVIEEVSSATLRIFSKGRLLTSRMEHTGRREAIATPGNTMRPGICV